LERPLPDPDSAAEILSYYYDNRDILKKDGQWCAKRLREELFTWPHIQQQLLEIVRRTLEAKAPEPEFKGFGTPVKIG
jgi:glycosyltransferase involved in cell wall biosynthesis